MRTANKYSRTKTNIPDSGGCAAATCGRMAARGGCEARPMSLGAFDGGVRGAFRLGHGSGSGFSTAPTTDMRLRR